MRQVAMPRRLGRVFDAAKRRIWQRQLRSIPVSPLTRPLVRLGSEWGGWHIPPDAIGAGSVCYCVGAGGDISFDLALLDRGATVRAIDPSVRFEREALDAAGGNPRFSFHRVALASQDGTLTLYGREDRDGVMSAANIYRTTASYDVPARTIPTLMLENGDERIDLLKLDIEGSEYDVLERFDPAEVGVKVLCVEFHHTARAARVRRVLDRLRAYEIVHRSSRSDFTLVQR